MICDFCHGPEPRRDRSLSITAASYKAPRMQVGRLCDAENRNGLVERAMQIAPPIPGAAQNELRELRSWAHGLFFRYRLPGEPTRIETKQS